MHNFTEDQRVQMHPATDRWMRGDRYGTVHQARREVVIVDMDASRQRVAVTPDLLLPVNQGG